jgi:hypothetical protein
MQSPPMITSNPLPPNTTTSTIQGKPVYSNFQQPAPLDHFKVNYPQGSLMAQLKEQAENQLR